MDIPFEQLKARYLALPDDVRTAISSSDMAEALYEIGQSHNLRIDEMEVLSKETGLVFLGITHPEAYVDRLRAALPMSKDRVPAIAKDINEKIFAPVKASIVDMHKKTPAIEPKPPANLPVAHTLGTDMAQAKMQGAFRLAPDTVKVEKAPPIFGKGYAQGQDPYREPVN